jgi:predicted DNA-binding transcriptional regulator AlpA
LSKKAVSAATSLSQVHLMRMVRNGRFPEPLKRGVSRICWKTSTVQAWIDSLTSHDRQPCNPYGCKGKPKKAGNCHAASEPPTALVIPSGASGMRAADVLKRALEILDALRYDYIEEAFHALLRYG